MFRQSCLRWPQGEVCLTGTISQSEGTFPIHSILEGRYAGCGLQ